MSLIWFAEFADIKISPQFMPVDYYSKGINIRKKYVMLLYEYYKFITFKKAPRCSEQLFPRGEKKISFTSILFYTICYFFRILALRNAYTYRLFVASPKHGYDEASIGF